MWSEDFLTTRLTSEQCEDKKYRVTRDGDGHVKLTSEQRRFIDAMLRKTLGSKFVAFAIWQVGLPDALLGQGNAASSGSVATEHATASEPRAGAAAAEDQVERRAEDIARWLGRVGREIAVRKQRDDYPEATRLGGAHCKTSPLTDADRTRKRKLEDVKQGLRRGQWLRTQVDTRELLWRHLSEKDQNLLEAYDANKLHRERGRMKRARLPPFHVQPF